MSTESHFTRPDVLWSGNGEGSAWRKLGVGSDRSAAEVRVNLLYKLERLRGLSEGAQQGPDVWGGQQWTQLLFFLGAVKLTHSPPHSYVSRTSRPEARSGQDLVKDLPGILGFCHSGFCHCFWDNSWKSLSSARCEQTAFLQTNPSAMHFYSNICL